MLVAIIATYFRTPKDARFRVWSKFSKNFLASSLSGYSKYEQVECTDPPEEGVVVLVICGKKGVGPPTPEGVYPIVPGTEVTVHSATSNGDGTYTSKNGDLPKKEDATEEEAFGPYMNPKDGDACYTICVKQKAG